jgi:hypothetical protein
VKRLSGHGLPLALLCLSACAFGKEISSGQGEAADPAPNLRDPVSLLIHKLERRQCHLKFEADVGYLRSVLKALGIPVSSQVLVFSKTSSQAKWTSSAAPRAIYFSDTVSVAWVPGS